MRPRFDLCFDECFVTELQYGRKKIFFTVLYRNPSFKANSPQFSKFLDDFRKLHDKIANENPVSTYFTGDFNAQTQAWYPDGTTNLEGTMLEDLFTSLNLKQIITEPTHYRDNCQPTCID